MKSRKEGRKQLISDGRGGKCEREREWRERERAERYKLDHRKWGVGKKVVSTLSPSL